MVTAPGTGATAAGRKTTGPDPPSRHHRRSATPVAHSNPPDASHLTRHKAPRRRGRALPTPRELTFTQACPRGRGVAGGEPAGRRLGRHDWGSSAGLAAFGNGHLQTAPVERAPAVIHERREGQHATSSDAELLVGTLQHPPRRPVRQPPRGSPRNVRQTGSPDPGVPCSSKYSAGPECACPWRPPRPAVHPSRRARRPCRAAHSPVLRRRHRTQPGRTTFDPMASQEAR